MKTKRALLLTTISLMSVSLTSCFFSFDDLFGFKIKSIEIADSNKAYILGDVYNDKSSLLITATFNNDKTRNYELSEVDYSFTYTQDDTLKYYDPSAAFTFAGTYTLSVTIEGVTSNSISINVLAEHIYATSITLTGQSTLNVWNETEFTVSVSPSNYTAPITYSANDDSKVKLTPTAGGVIVYATSGGEVDITAKIANSKTTFIYSTVHVTISASIGASTASQTYKDYTENNYYRLSSCPSSGNVKLLVIPVWLTDSAKYIATSKKASVRNDINNIYFGTKTATGWHSVSSYYYEESGGALNISGTVSEWYDSGLNTTTVGNYSSKSTAKNVVKEATDWYFNNHPSDSRKNYDYDGDGYLDGVILIYAAPDCQAASALSTCKNLWAYCFWVQDPASVFSPVVNVFFWASYDFIYGRSNAFERTGGSYYNGDTSHCVLDGHTYIHEMGHVLGLEDYYDYGGNHYEPAGGFSMQDCNVGGHDPFSSFALGWGKAYIPAESCEITLRSFQDSHEMILLTPEWNEYNSPFDEYLLLELYTPYGLNELDTKYQYGNAYPQGVNKIGVRLWHVDARLLRRDLDNPVFTSNARIGNVVTGFLNTYYHDSNDYEMMCEAYAFNHSYGELNLLQLIRNDTSANYHPTSLLRERDLFLQGHSFSMETFFRQFYNGNLLNSNKALGWSFNVKEISTNESGETFAKIELTRS